MKLKANEHETRHQVNFTRLKSREGESKVIVIGVLLKRLLLLHNPRSYRWATYSKFQHFVISIYQKTLRNLRLSFSLSLLN